MSYDLYHLNAPTLADQAYEQLRSAILAGDIKAGDRLTDRGLAASMAVSPTPVREALRRLEQDRLVERSGPKNVRVTSYSPKALAEITVVAATLRALAAKLAATNATEADLSAISDLLDKADGGRAALARAIDSYDIEDDRVGECADQLIAGLREFHAAVNRACHNDVVLHLIRMTEAFGLVHRQRTLRQELKANDPGPSKRYEQHRELLEALQARDADAAERIMLSHARRSSVNLIQN